MFGVADCGMRKNISRLVSGLRWRLLVLVLLACAPLVGLMLHTASEDRRRVVKNWKQRSQDMMHLATREEEQVIHQARQLLFALGESSQVRSGKRRDCKKLLDELFGSYPRYANLGVVSTNGNVLASALPMAETANQTNRSYFSRALATRAFAIGDFPDGEAAGKPTVNFGHPVFDATGQVQAVVFATLDLDWVSRFESELQAQLPRGATWTEIDRAGRILVRYPAPEKWIGQPFPEKSLLKTVFSQEHGVVEAISVDGIPGYHAFTAMRSPLIGDDVVTILGSIPRQVLFADANRRLTENLIGLGMVAGLAFILGWIGSYLLVLRPVRTLVKSSAQLATGEFSARTGLAHRGDELGQLTRTFDQMAQALEQREQDRRRAEQELRQSEERFRALVQNSTDVIGITDETGIIVYCSPSLPNSLGYEASEVLGKNIAHYLWPEDLVRAQGRQAELVKTPGATQWDEYRLRHRDESCRFIECTSSNYLHDSAISGLVFNYRDITKRKRAEEELRGNEVRLRSVMESTADGLLVVDQSGRVIIQNGRFGEMWRIPSELLGSGDDDALLAHVVGQLSEPEAFLVRVRALYGTDAEDMDELRFKDGRVFERFSRPLVLQGAVMGRVWSFRDVTKRKQAEGKLEVSRQRLRVLSRRLVEVQEAERRHIALELHDEIGQALTVAEMNLQAALQTPGNDALKPRLKAGLDAVERVLEQVQDISLNLRPSMLDDLGLEPALVWLTNRQAELAGLKGEVQADALEHRLDPGIETECFRVAQEALTNVVRHAQAKAVTVELRQADGQIHLRVRDDGIGFDVPAVREKAVRGGSLGLLSMEERAVLAGGGLEFNPAPGRGTEVHAWFPLKWQTPLSESATP